MIIWYRMISSVSVVYPYGDLADWELWLATSAQHLKRVTYYISLTWEKIKIQNLKRFLLIIYRFYTMIKLKNPTSNHYEVENHLYSIRYWKINTFTSQLVGPRNLQRRHTLSFEEILSSAQPSYDDENRPSEEKKKKLHTNERTVERIANK